MESLSKFGPFWKHSPGSEALKASLRLSDSNHLFVFDVHDIIEIHLYGPAVRRRSVPKREKAVIHRGNFSQTVRFGF